MQQKKAFASLGEIDARCFVRPLKHRDSGQSYLGAAVVPALAGKVDDFFFVRSYYVLAGWAQAQDVFQDFTPPRRGNTF
ncbi:MAG: hypothetical protein NUV48_14055 [Peptococcaceae bacterium]|nr:hypothetical protein [Peptococcaceae bacterium]